MKHRQTFAAFAAVLTASACAPLPERSAFDFLSASPAALTDYQRGKRDLEAGNFGLALEHFTAAIDRDPNNVAAINGKAIALAKLDRETDAKAAFEQALAIDHTSALTRGNYAIFQARHDEPVKAAETSQAPRAVETPEPAPVAVETVPARAPTPSLTIANASGQYRLARRLHHYLSSQGFPAKRVANAGRFDRSQSVLFCHAQSRDAAETIRRALPANVKLVVLLSKANTIELVAGRDLDNFDTKLALAANTEMVR
jgi:tetratricopeptide (TPR) repeat protein